MALKVNTHDAKSRLSWLIEQAEKGEDVVIARAGTPVVRLVRVPPSTERRLGGWRGEVSLRDDFDAPLTEDELFGTR